MSKPCNEARREMFDRSGREREEQDQRGAGDEPSGAADALDDRLPYETCVRSRAGISPDVLAWLLYSDGRSSVGPVPMHLRLAVVDHPWPL